MIRMKYSLRVAKVLIASAYLALGGIAAWLNSPTYDEVGHLPAGIAHWQLARFEPYAVNPPLLRTAATLPLYIAGVRVDPSTLKTTLLSRSEFDAGRKLVKEYGTRSQYLFFAGRIVNLAITLLGLNVCMTWAAELYGNRASILAGIFWCFNPMILGHAGLVTPDVGAASLGVWTLYQFKLWMGSCSLTRMVTFGLSLGLALSSKFTWLPIMAIIFTMAVGWSLFQKSSWHKCVRTLGQAVVAVGIALLVMNVFYGFDRSCVRLGHIPLVSRSLKPQSAVSGYEVNRFSATPLGKSPVPLPILYVQGIDFQKRDLEKPWDPHSYLMGQWKEGGWKTYYAVALLVKTPLPMLLAALIAITLAARSCKSALSVRRVQQPASDYPAPTRKSLDYFILIAVPLLIFVLVSSQTGFNRHLRYLLPAYPPVIILISSVATVGRTRIRRALFQFFAITQIATTILAAPHFLEYFNLAVGGTSAGKQWLLGSNLDWGQDLLRLREWQKSHPEAQPLYLAVDTPLDPADLGITYMHWPRDDQNNRVIDETMTDGFWVAASVNHVMGRPIKHKPAQIPVNFEHAKPVDKVSHTIEIFHFLHK